ncbi:MAG: ATP-binding protein, partial [Candidatus Desulfatibia sp.]|uniref:sensor histidine kinase n=1 Tax=Candidatus Desulfatibia sp. TaxID=3101189 RepID=UPI002F2BFD2B
KDFANIDFGEYIKSLVNGLFTSHGVDTNKVKLNIEIKDVLFDLENAIPCGLIINELVSNSLKHAFHQQEEGNISIVLQSINEDELELTVSDDGVGIPEELDIRGTESMGLHLVKVLAGHQLDGTIDLDRTGGTQFNIKFKRAAYKPRI